MTSRNQRKGRRALRVQDIATDLDRLSAAKFFLWGYYVKRDASGKAVEHGLVYHPNGPGWRGGHTFVKDTSISLDEMIYVCNIYPGQFALLKTGEIVPAPIIRYTSAQPATGTLTRSPGGGSSRSSSSSSYASDSLSQAYKAQKERLKAEKAAADLELLAWTMAKYNQAARSNTKSLTEILQDYRSSLPATN